MGCLHTACWRTLTQVSGEDSSQKSSSAMQESPSKPKSESDFDECYFFEPYSDGTGFLQPA